MANGEVYQIHIDPEKSRLQIGDRIISIGNISIDDYSNHLQLTFFNGTSPGQIIPIEIERDDQSFSIDWVYAGRTREQVIQIINSGWWLPYVVWMAGTATLLFIRPKDLRWRLLVAFNYLTAFWLVTGSGPAKWHLWGSGILLRMAIWMSIPIYLHLHWVFPRTLKKLPRGVWGCIYAIGTALALLQFFELLSPDGYYTGFLIAVFGSILLILAHAIFQKEARNEIGWLVLVVMLILIPIAGSVLLEILGISISVYMQGGSLLAMPALPGAYFFVAYRRQMPSNHKNSQLFLIYLAAILLSTVFIIVISVLSIDRNFFDSTIGIGFVTLFMGITISIVSFTPFFVLPALAQADNITHKSDIQIRANRLLPLLIALIGLAVLFGLLSLSLSPWLEFSGATVVIGTIAAIASGLLSILTYPSLKQFVDQKILKIPFPPAQLDRAYAEHITTSLDQESLNSLINDEILPSLFIRQSALFGVENLSLKPINLFGVDETQLPKYGSLSELLNEANIYRPPNEALLFPWIRLILPLTVEGQLQGLWLLGRRDPDDHYSGSEIDLLKTIANQTAIALANILSREQILTLYQENILRHEDERKKLAHDLHDDILSSLAVLGMLVDDEFITSEFQREYEKLTTRIRQIINGLRPAMLDYGLYQAIDELIQELTDRSPSDFTINFLIGTSKVRYEYSLEGHIYRIVQQALENAFQHANAHHISVSGELLEDRIILLIEDDGIGFDYLASFDNVGNNSEKHYGLTMMQERAEIIGAQLEIKSSPGMGTWVALEISEILQKQSQFSARIAAEKALLESEKKLNTLMNATPDVIFLSDIDGNIIQANEAMASRFNVRADELIGTCVWDLISPEMVNQRKPFIEKAIFTGVPQRFEDKRAGIWFDNIVYPITNEIGEVTEVAIYARDITERKQLENDLLESAEETKALLNAPTVLIALHKTDGTILDVNQAMASRLNVSVDELIGHSVWDYFPPAVAKQRKEYAKQVMKSQKPVRFKDKNHGVWFDTTLYPLFDADGSVKKFAVFVREIEDNSEIDPFGI